MTVGSVLVSLLITTVLSRLFNDPVGPLGYSLAVIIPAVTASFAGYVTLSLYFELEQSRQEIQTLAVTDHLTQIINRRHFFELADRELERFRRSGSPLTIVLFDIDNFKQVNDNFGHLGGDQVLQQVCKTCRSVARSYDIFARFGGEEFIFLLPGSNTQRARAFTDRLRQTVSNQAISVNGTVVSITISIGTAVTTSRGDTLDDLISRADHALYKAKNLGKNHIEIA